MLTARRRRLVIGATYVVNALFAGVVFGWAPLQVLLEEDGQYAELCGDAPGCDAQLNRLAAVYAVGSTAAMLSGFPNGWVVDHYGAAVGAVVGGAEMLLALLGLAVADSRSFDVFAPAYALIGVGGNMGLTLSLPASTLVAEPATVISGANAMFDAAPLAFLVCLLVFQAGASRAAVFGAYACVCVLVYSTLVAAWGRSAPAGAADEQQQHHAEPLPDELRPPMHSLPLREQLRTRRFAWLAAFSALHSLHNVTTLGVAKDDLAERGDDDNLYAALFTAALPLPALWFGLFGRVISRLGVDRAAQLVDALAVLHCAIALVPALELQPLGFLVFTNYRVLLYSLMSSYVVVAFGAATAGRLVGCLFTIAAAFAPLLYPTVALTNSHAGGDYGVVYAVHLVLALGMGCWTRSMGAAPSTARGPVKAGELEVALAGL